MNPRKIAAICNTNNEAAYAECVRYLQAQRLPDGFELEFVPVTGAKSMTSGYNEGMSRTEARYKVYLHQDALIVNPNFLREMIGIFEQSPDVGLLGLIGASRLPANGIWWEGGSRVGKVYHSNAGRMSLLDLGGGERPWTEVETVDGFLMATQYDLPWREYLFPGWHFYDASQCREFALAGYKVVVPYQEEPWCVHDCGLTLADSSFGEAAWIYERHYGSASAVPNAGETG